MGRQVEEAEGEGSSLVIRGRHPAMVGAGGRCGSAVRPT
jgi:hypothetical protein